MKAYWAAALMALGVVATGRLQAQAPILRPPGGYPVTQPAYSPYLNLLRNDNPLYVNYYGLVRPEFEFRSQIYGLQQGVAANAAAISSYDTTTGLPLTGHPTQFLNTSHYFLNRGGQAAPGMAPATAMIRAAPSPPSSPTAPQQR
jgi:hypothetical protein